MSKTNDSITFKGNKISIAGRAIKEGDTLPSFKVTGNDLKDLTEADFAGKVLVLSAVPSLDTPVCATETKRFNQEASELGSDVRILTVSMDLPFAQKRWCAAEGVTGLTTASDYKYRSFGEAFGTYIKELGLLTRAVFVADRTGKVVYVEYVDEVTQEPNYSAALDAVRRLL